MGETVLAKACTSCHQEKLTSLFHLKGTDKSGFPRHQSICKDCANMSRIARYHKKKTRPKASKRFDVGSCMVEIIFHQGDQLPPNLTEVMNDYIEAVYASRSQITGA